MRIKHIYIEKYKNIENLNLKLNTEHNHNIIIGENGSGKTNLFEAVLLMLEHLSVGSKANFSFEITIENKGKIKVFNNSQTPGDKDLKLMFPENIILYHAGDSKRVYELIKNLKSLSKNINLVNLEYVTQKQILLYKNKDINKIVLYFQPSQLKKLKRENNIDMYINANLFIERFVKFNEMKEGRTYSLEIKKDVFDGFLSKNKIDVINLFYELRDTFSNRYESRNDYFEIYFNDGLEFSELGEGEQLLMVLKNTFRLFKENTLFLLDEPDSLIYPQRMEELIELLEGTNNLGFITTHSPILISRLKNSDVIYLSEEIKFLGSKYGKNISYVLEDEMNFSSYPKEIIEIKAKFNRLIMENNFDNAREILNSLIKLLGEKDTLVIQLKTRLKLKEVFLND